MDFYTQNTTKNGTGTVYVSQIAVELYSFWFRSPKTFSRDFVGEDQNYKESLGAGNIFKSCQKNST